MRCRACWSDRAIVSPLSGWRGLLASCLLVAPIQCRHCFHRFFVPFWQAGQRGWQRTEYAAGTGLPAEATAWRSTVPTTAPTRREQPVRKAA